MNLAVITVHYQNPSLTQSLIDSVKDCSIVGKIVVVSHDSFLLSSGGKLEFLQQPNRGYAAGLNRAMEVVMLSGIQTVLATNPDVLLDCKIVEALLNDHQKYGADCTFPVLSEMGRNLHGYRFSKFGSLQITEDPEWFSGACFVVNVATWKKIGGINETFFHYFEDRDLCLRIRKSGGKLHQAKNILIVHRSKSGDNFAQQELPKFAVRNHLLSLEQSGRLNPLTFLNVILRHFLYLFRWKRGWRGIGGWAHGIQEFLTKKRVGVVK
jgi:GT2 family glycosyltransferase